MDRNPFWKVSNYYWAHMHNLKKKTRYTNSFSYLPTINVTFLIFSLLPPVWLPVVLPRCFTPVCNPVVLPRPCRVEVLEPFPRRVYPVCLSPPPWNEKWETDYFFVCIHLANYFPKIIVAKTVFQYLFHSTTSVLFNSEISISREMIENVWTYINVSYFVGEILWRYVFIATMSWIFLNRDLAYRSTNMRRDTMEYNRWKRGCRFFKT